VSPSETPTTRPSTIYDAALTPVETAHRATAARLRHEPVVIGGLVPQVFNAQRYECELAPYPRIMRIFDDCMKLDAFASMQPMKQADASI
jgi:glutathione S-transferase